MELDDTTLAVILWFSTGLDNTTLGQLSRVDLSPPPPPPPPPTPTTTTTTATSEG